MFSDNFYKDGNVTTDLFIPFCISRGYMYPIIILSKSTRTVRSEHDIILATRKNRLDMIQILIEAKWPPSESALVIAIENNCIPIIDFLVQSRLEDYITYSKLKKADISFAYFSKIKDLMNFEFKT